MFVLFITSERLVRCITCSKEHANDRHLNNNLINYRITVPDKQNNNEFSAPYYYNNIININNNNNDNDDIFYYQRRDKRTPKKPDSLASIRKRLKESQKLKDMETMTGDDGQIINLQQSNLNNGIRMDQPPQYGGLKTEQTSNRSQDKMHQLKAINQIAKEQNYVLNPTECDFEGPCSWKWNSNDEFLIVNSNFYKQHKYGPVTDPFNDTKGKFILFFINKIEIHPGN